MFNVLLISSQYLSLLPDDDDGNLLSQENCIQIELSLEGEKKERKKTMLPLLEK